MRQVVLSVPEWVVPSFLEINGRVGAQRHLSKDEKDKAERDARESGANEAATPASSPSNHLNQQTPPVHFCAPPIKITPLESGAYVVASLSTTVAAELTSAAATAGLSTTISSLSKE